MRRVLIVAVAVVASVSLAGTPAVAHKQIVTDPNDTQGKLDIKRANLDHHGHGDTMMIILTLKTYGKWAKHALLPPRGTITFEFKRSPESFYRIDIRQYGDGKLHGILEFCNPSGCEPAGYKTDANHRTKRSVRFKIPRGALEGAADNQIKWFARTAFGEGCSGHCFFDKAPDGSQLAHHQLP